MYFNSTHMFSKNSSLGLTVSFFVPKSLIVLVSTGLETYVNKLYKSLFLCSVLTRVPLNLGESNRIPIVLSAEGHKLQSTSS